MSTPGFNPALFLYLNPELQAYSNVISVEAASNYYYTNPEGSNLLYSLDDIPPQFDANVYITDRQNLVNASALNHVIYTAMVNEGYDPKLLESTGRYVSTIYEDMVLEDTNRFVLTDSNYELNELNNLSSNDWIKILKNNGVVLYTKVSEVVSSNVFTVQHPYYPNFTIRDPSATYTLMGIKIYDADRLARIHYLRYLDQDSNVTPQVPGNITYTDDFNYELYQVLYPDARVLSKEAAYIDYVSRQNNNDARIPNANGFFTLNSKPEIEQIYNTILTNGLALDDTFIANRNAYFNAPVYMESTVQFKQPTTFYTNVNFEPTATLMPTVTFNVPVYFNNGFNTANTVTLFNGLIVYGDVVLDQVPNSLAQNTVQIKTPFTSSNTTNLHHTIVNDTLHVKDDLLFFDQNTNATKQKLDVYGLLHNTMLVTENAHYVQEWVYGVAVNAFSSDGFGAYTLVVNNATLACILIGTYVTVERIVFQVINRYKDADGNTRLTLSDVYYAQGHQVGTRIKTGASVDVAILKNMIKKCPDDFISTLRTIPIGVLHLEQDPTDLSKLVVTCAYPNEDVLRALQGDYVSLQTTLVKDPQLFERVDTLRVVRASTSVSTTDGQLRVQLVLQMLSSNSDASGVVTWLNQNQPSEMYLYRFDSPREQMLFHEPRVAIGYAAIPDDTLMLHLFHERLTEAGFQRHAEYGTLLGLTDDTITIDNGLGTPMTYTVTYAVADDTGVYMRTDTDTDTGGEMYADIGSVSYNTIGVPVVLQDVLSGGSGSNVDTFTYVVKLHDAASASNLVEMLDTYVVDIHQGFLQVTDVYQERTWRIISKTHVAPDTLHIAVKDVDYGIIDPSHIPLSSPQGRVIYVAPLRIRKVNTPHKPMAFTEKVGINTLEPTEWLSVNGDVSCKNALSIGDDVNRFQLTYSNDTFKLDSAATIENAKVTVHRNSHVEGMLTAYSILNISDRRMKKDITDTLEEEDLAHVKDLAVREYAFKAPEQGGARRRKGLIAQEAEQVAQRIVNEINTFIPFIHDTVEVSRDGALMIPKARVDAEDPLPLGKSMLQAGDTLRLRITAGASEQQQPQQWLDTTITKVDYDEEQSMYMVYTNNAQPPLSHQCFLFGYRGTCKVIDQDQLIMMNINAVKALCKEIDVLKQQIQDLRAPSASV